jgi:PIN domain nuclease of toxin-antitoxin system
LERPLRLLLDTHVWIWALHCPDRLDRTVRRLLESPKTKIYLSPISIWEAHHLHKRGRLRTRQSFADWLDKALSAAPLNEAPFNFAVAAEAAQISLPQSDPDDVFLAATASAFGLTLVTADPQLLACSRLKTLAGE